MGDNIKMDVNKRSSGQEQLAGCFEHDNELSVCHNFGKFLESLRKYQLFKKYQTTQTYLECLLVYQTAA